MKYVLAIDLGTSGPKSAIISTHGEVIDFDFVANDLRLFPGGGAEQDPDQWWSTIVETSRKVIDRAPVKADDIIAVCCTAQWSGTVAVDTEGRHLCDAIIWLDSRGQQYIHEMVNGPVKVEGYDIVKLSRWLRLTGGVPTRSGKDPIAHILYLKHEQPELYTKTFKFLEPKDYINLKLTGKFAASYDSITLYWLTDNRDVNNVHYNKKLLKMAGIEMDKLPGLKKATDVLGPVTDEVADQLGLVRGTPVVMGTPDIHSASIGSGAVRDFEGHLYIGTSSWIITHVPFKKTDIMHSMASLPSAIPGRYMLTTEQETAGACLNYLRDNILYCEDELDTGAPPEQVYKLFDTIAAGVGPGCDGLIFTPWLYGERTPVENHTVRSGFFNQSLSTTRAHFIRAVFEGVAFNSRWLLQYVEKFIKRRMDYLNMIGGGANSDLWCQIYADVLDRTIRQVKDPIQANARGAAFLASVAMGEITFDDIPEKIQVVREFDPNPRNRKTYDGLFKEFLNIYKANNKIYDRLNRH